jgi:MFS family permease
MSDMTPAQHPSQAAAVITEDPATHFPVDARRNILAFSTDLATAMAGLSFVPATIVLVGLASRFTENKALLGIVAMIGSVSWFLPQIVSARIVHGKKHQKPYMVIPLILGRNSYLFMAIWLFVTQARDSLLTLWILIACIAILFITDSLASVAWFDILSRVLSPRARGRSLATGSFVGLIAGIGSGLIVERLLSPGGLSFPTNYAVIFLCAWVCFQSSSIAIMCIRETPMSDHEHAQTADSNFIKNLLVAVRTDRIMQRLIMARVFTGIETMAAAFYVVFIRERMGVNDSILGIFSIASVVGGILGTMVFGWLGDRRGSRRVIQFSVALQVIAPTLAFAVAAIPVITDAAPEIAVGCFIVVIGINGAVGQAGLLGFQGYPLDIAPERHRAMYVGVLNSVSGVVSLTPLLGGILLEWLTRSISSETAYSIVFGIAALCVFVGLIVSFGLPKPHLS